MDDLLEEFVAETRETLEAISGEIVAWESDPADRRRLDAIFRFVHTVKGSCGFLDLPRLERLSHAAEEVLAAVRDGKRTPDTALVDAVLAIVDRIGEIVEAIDTGAALDDSGEDLLILALEEGAVAAPRTAATIQRAPTRSVRLAVDLLDRMMSGMSDMVLVRNELARRLRDNAIDPAAQAALERLTMTVAEMRDTVTRTRMQTIDTLFSALPRMVRDTAVALGKSVTVAIEGGDVELDRELVEMIRDPLVHIIRNAIDHGIEAPADRRAAGKSENGQLRVSARQSGNQVVIEVSDDGRGIDTARLVRRAAENGRSEAELRAMSEAERIELIFEPGFTSKDEVTAISGRGVGMDVVRANIDQIGGRIELANKLGRGLSVTIRVPLTLAILSTIVVGVGEHRFAVPRQAIEEIMALRGDALRIDELGGRRIATLRDERLPIVDLGDEIGSGRTDRNGIMIVVGVPGGRFGLIVDAVFDTEELVVRPASPAVMASGIYAGQTLPDSGQPMLLLDCVGLAASASLRFGRESSETAAPIPETEVEREPALLFDAIDGVRRLIPLAAIDRIEMSEASAVRRRGDRLHVTADDGIVRLIGLTETVDHELCILRLSDGVAHVAYAVREAIDIVPLPDGVIPTSSECGREIAGIVLLDGEQVEVVDVHRVLADNVAARDPAKRGTVMVTGERADWLKAVLAPMIRRAGYRVVTTLRGGEKADLILTLDDDGSPASGGAPVLKLHNGEGEPNREGISLYDRDAILNLLAGAAR